MSKGRKKSTEVQYDNKAYKYACPYCEEVSMMPRKKTSSIWDEFEKSKTGNHYLECEKCEEKVKVSKCVKGLHRRSSRNSTRTEVDDHQEDAENYAKRIEPIEIKDPGTIITVMDKCPRCEGKGTVTIIEACELESVELDPLSGKIMLNAKVTKMSEEVCSFCKGRKGIFRNYETSQS